MIRELLILYLLFKVLCTTASADTVANVKVFHRSGQTFITWQEDRVRSGELYRIYRNSSPIVSSSDLTSSRVVATLAEDSSLYYTDIARGQFHGESYKPLRRYVIRDRGPQLADGTGLFVNTVDSPGVHYYAVTQITGNMEDKRIAPGSVSRAVNETVEHPKAVLVWQSSNGLNRIYTMWMDYKNWNSTYDAPRAFNGYYGLGGPQQVSLRRAAQYAYSFHVAVPGGYNPSSGKKYPVGLSLHAWGERYLSIGQNQIRGWPIIEIMPDDPNKSWYYGFSGTHDYRTNAAPANGTIVNFTEDRILQTLQWVMQDSYYKCDSNRIYAYGQSMGGSGALAFGMRYPNVFSQIYAGQPMTNYKTAFNWSTELQGKWGIYSKNLRIETRGEFAEHLQRYNGQSVWDWQNHQRQLGVRRNDEMSYLSVDHGSRDLTMRWSTQGKSFYLYADASKHAYSGAVRAAGHEWQNFAARSPNGFDFGARFFPARNEPIIAFSRASGSSGFPTPDEAAYNRNLQWAARGRQFGPLIADTPEEFSFTVRSIGGSQIADLTPRRIQKFVIQPGREYRWINRLLPGEQIVQQGRVKASGLITLPAIQISTASHRITITF
jgi:hypothetical protein